MNVVALFVIVVSMIPVYIATRLAERSVSDRAPGDGRVAAASDASASPKRCVTLAIGVTPVPIGQATPVPPSPQ